MADSNRLVSFLRELLEENIIVGPALASVGIGGLSPDIYEQTYQEAQRLVRIYWKYIPPVPGTVIPISTSVIVHMMTETLTSTAAFLSHIQLGYLELSETMVTVAVRLLEEFAKTHDNELFHTANMLVCLFDNLQVVRHDKTMSIDSFVTGERHRPWIHYSLEHELALMQAAETVRLVHENEPFIELTAKGHAQYEEIRQILQDSGYLSRRAALMRLSAFSQFQDYDELVDRMGDLPTARQMILQRADIQPGMRVLELGCGTGALTIDAGLYKQVGEQGEVVATDPSFGMLVRARQKAAARGVTRVSFLPFRAEALNFSDDSFDAIVGCSFLHFVDLPQAIREIHRVAKPGARFTTYYPLHYAESKRFFQDWFAPLLEKVKPGQRRDRMPSATDVPEALDPLFEDFHLWSHAHPIRYHCPEDVIRFFIEVGNVFEPAFIDFPWQAKEEMRQELIARGHEIVSGYDAEELVQYHPHQLISARAVKTLGQTS